jgi:hypothetical protein
VREDYIQHIARPNGSNIRFLMTFVLRYEGSCHFQFYISDIGIPFAFGVQRRYLTPPIHQAVLDWFYAIKAQKIRRVAKARMAVLKEELMAAAWHPKRVERLLAAGGFEAIDC